MISDWRIKFDNKSSPFLIVQLPNFKRHQNESTISNWAILREAQADASELFNVHTITTIDIGDEENIHPQNKKDVGYRLSLMALKKIYGYKNLVHTGPSLKSVQYKDNKAILVFENVGTGLKSNDGKLLREFALAGLDKKFVCAKAKIIDNNMIELSTNKIEHPVAVRYAWKDNPVVNLYNNEGLPAAPFRADKW